MKSVAQKHDFGCGAACIAFILGQPYDEVVAELGIRAAQTTGYGCQKLCKLLSTGSKRYRFKRLKLELQYLLEQDGVIVFIKRSVSHPAGHYLCRRSGFWMDPWINLSESHKLADARSGFREILPGDPEFIIFPS